MPSLTLVQELALAATGMRGLWGHSAQTTACFRATSAVPVGVQQPGKAGTPNLGGFSNKSVIPLGEGNGENIHHALHGWPSWARNSVTVMGHLVVWPPWAYFKICCPGRETKEAGMGLGGDLRVEGYSSC